MTYRRLAVALSLCIALSAASRAEAQIEGQTIGTTPKATIGLGLVGAEIGFVVPALTGLHSWWAFTVFPTVGAAGGAVAGYYLIDRPGHTGWSVAMLVTGMALVLPALVTTLWATAFDPEREADVIRTGGQLEIRARRDERRRQYAARREELRQAGAGVLRHTPRGFSVGVPALHVVSAYDLADRLRYRLPFEPEIHVELFTGAFD